MPEFYLGYDWKKDGWTLGLGAEVMRLAMPETVKVKEDEYVSAEDHISSCALNAYVQYHSPSGKLQVKAKSIYGGNMSHLLLLSGFGLSDYTVKGAHVWTNVKNSTSWMDVVYGKTWKVGLFLGYMKNLGTEDNLLSESTTYIFGFTTSTTSTASLRWSAMI